MPAGDKQKEAERLKMKYMVRGNEEESETVEPT